jgi:hypothetical protein
VVSRRLFVLVVAFGASGIAGFAAAEPIFLSRQYARCTTCHYSPTGGGLLTPYGRSLSRQELSTTGSSGSAQPAGREEEFLFGALREALGPVHLGVELRPAHLDFHFGDSSSSRNFLMTADLLAAYRVKEWTFYAQVGRQPLSEGGKIDSFENWVSRQPEKGIGFRVGRFFPAYGVRFADHTAFNRTGLGFNTYDQLYAVELSRTGERNLVQLTVGPGRAESILDDDGRRAFTAAGRYQRDLNPRMSIVVSGLYRNESEIEPRNGSGGLAFGFAPTPRVSLWTQADARFREGDGSTAYTLLNETGFEVYRGIWLTVSPQLRTDFGQSSGGVFRMALGANLLPRTHWNVVLKYYRDKNRDTDLVIKTFPAQPHLYL